MPVVNKSKVIDVTILLFVIIVNLQNFGNDAFYKEHLIFKIKFCMKAA